MQLTKESKLLMSFFLKNKCIEHTKQTKKTQVVFKQLFNEIKNAEKYIEFTKNKRGDSFYNTRLTEIESSFQILKPETFPADGFPSQIREYIDKNIYNELTYSIDLLDRKIKIHFLLEDINIKKNIKLYNNYVDNMLIWLTIINEYASKICAKELTIFLYFTSLKKNIPESNINILDEYNINTAFTMTCPKKSEIVIYRKEEWFKVFLHETFHNFGLDFSDMNNEACNKKMLDFFPVKTEMNLYESYAEFWAKIMNALFCSYRNLSDKNDEEEFLNNSEFFINYEIMYSFFQMVKVLNFMNLKYEYLYSKDADINDLRNTLYREKTSVFAYYVITLILLSDYQGFICWCNTHNMSLLQFKKTQTNQDQFCDFIIKKYKNKLFLKNIHGMEEQFYRIKQHKNKNKKDLNYITKNLRMTICELG